MQTKRSLATRLGFATLALAGCLSSSDVDSLSSSTPDDSTFHAVTVLRGEQVGALAVAADALRIGQRDRQVAIQVPTKTGFVDCALTPHDRLYAADAKSVIVDGNGHEEADLHRATFFRSESDQGTFCRLSFIEDTTGTNARRARGFIQHQGAFYSLETLSPTGPAAFGAASDELLEIAEIDPESLSEVVKSCALMEAPASSNPSSTPQAVAQGGASATRYISLATDADSFLWDYRGAGANAYIASIIDAVNGIYEANGVGVQMVITSQRIFKERSNDPYAKVDAPFDTIGYQWSPQRTGSRKNAAGLVQFFTGRELGYGLAWLGIPCSDWGASSNFGPYSLISPFWKGSGSEFALTVVESAHELGHSWGMHHQAAPTPVNLMRPVATLTDVFLPASINEAEAVINAVLRDSTRGDKCLGTTPPDGHTDPPPETAKYNISGRVGRLAPGGPGVAGITITVYRNGNEEASTTTAADGSYSLANIVTGNIVLQASTPPAGTYLTPTNYTGYLLEEWKNKNFSVMDPPDGRGDLVVHVNDRAGNPLAGATVDAGALGQRTSDAQGLATFTNLNIGTAYTVSVSLEGYKVQPGSIASTIDNSDQTHLFFSVKAVAQREPTLLVRGLVKLEGKDRVVQGITINLRAADGSIVTDLTGPGGRYRFDKLTAGQYTVSADGGATVNVTGGGVVSVGPDNRAAAVHFSATCKPGFVYAKRACVQP